ncbi:MAG: hypothetical protein HQL64_13425 [Magnetococcales bacterium]|nr:hypothetical protein [Magnetococcales bacterium]
MTTPPEKTSSDRVFGLVFSAIFAAIGVWPLLHGQPPQLFFLAAGGLLSIVALVVPKMLHPCNQLWTSFGDLLHRVMTPLIMGLMFFVVMTPLGLLMRLAGKDGLRLRIDKAATSYWIPRTPPGPEPESCKNQF